MIVIVRTESAQRDPRFLFGAGRVERRFEFQPDDWAANIYDRQINGEEPKIRGRIKSREYWQRDYEGRLS